jgi:hypothetical protein
MVALCSVITKQNLHVEYWSGFIWLQPSVEGLWAMKALEHAEVYFNVSVRMLYAL